MATCNDCGDTLCEWTEPDEPRVFLCSPCLFKIATAMRIGCNTANPEVRAAIRSLDYAIAYGADWHKMENGT